MVDEKRLAQLRKQGFQPGQSGNPKGGKKGAKRVQLRHLLNAHLQEKVTREVPDSAGRSQLIKITRMELMTRLMVAMVFNPDADPAFRRECLKQILARVDPVSTGGLDGAGQPLVIVIRREAGMAFAEQLQRTTDRLPALGPPHIIDALRSTPVDLDFNGLSNGNGGNDNECPRLPADDPGSD